MKKLLFPISILLICFLLYLNLNPSSDINNISSSVDFSNIKNSSPSFSNNTFINYSNETTFSSISHDFSNVSLPNVELPNLELPNSDFPNSYITNISNTFNNKKSNYNTKSYDFNTNNKTLYSYNIRTNSDDKQVLSTSLPTYISFSSNRTSSKQVESKSPSITLTNDLSDINNVPIQKCDPSPPPLDECGHWVWIDPIYHHGRLFKDGYWKWVDGCTPSVPIGDMSFFELIVLISIYLLYIKFKK